MKETLYTCMCGYIYSFFILVLLMLIILFIRFLERKNFGIIIGNKISRNVILTLLLGPLLFAGVILIASMLLSIFFKYKLLELMSGVYKTIFYIVYLFIFIVSFHKADKQPQTRRMLYYIYLIFYVICVILLNHYSYIKGYLVEKCAIINNTNTNTYHFCRFAWYSVNSIKEAIISSAIYDAICQLKIDEEKPEVNCD